MDPITISESPAAVTVPAHTTVEYHDVNGNLFAKFDLPRPYQKICKFAVPDELLPLTATFTAHPEPAPAGSADVDPDVE